MECGRRGLRTTPSCLSNKPAVEPIALVARRAWRGRLARAALEKAVWIGGGPRGGSRVDRPITQEAIAGEHLGGEFEYAHVAFEASHGSGLADRRPGRPCPQNRQCRLNENVRAFAGMGAFTF